MVRTFSRKPKNKIRRFVVGDIHGGYLALMQCIERSGFNKNEDLLISLGDMVDGWPESKKCIQYFYDLPNKIWVRGNHDQWFIDWISGKGAPPIWTQQGGQATVNSYEGQPPSPINPHGAFSISTEYILEMENMLFIHGGFRPSWHPALEMPDILMWDRTLIREAHRNFTRGYPTNWRGYSKIFIGHTSVTNFGFETPQTWGNLVAMDTGGGWEGKLSIMDIDSGEYWQSDLVADLYSEVTIQRGGKGKRYG